MCGFIYSSVNRLGYYLDKSFSEVLLFGFICFENWERANVRDTEPPQTFKIEIFEKAILSAE